MSCDALLVSGDQTTYANPCEVGVKLFTAFSDGTFLVSATGPALEPEIANPTMTKYCGAATVADAWARHQIRIRSGESHGMQVDREIRFFHLRGHVGQRDGSPVEDWKRFRGQRARW